MSRITPMRFENVDGKSDPCRLGEVARTLSARFWLLLHVVPGQEAVVVERLARVGVFAWTPVREVWRHRSAWARRRGARKVLARYAAAPGYVVAGLDDSGSPGRPFYRWVSVMACEGVVRVHEGRDGPLRLRPADVRAIAGMCTRAADHQALMPSRREFGVGDAVRVTGGPLEGLAARVVGIEGGDAELAVAGVLQAGVRLRAALGMLEAA